MFRKLCLIAAVTGALMFPLSAVAGHGHGGHGHGGHGHGHGHAQHSLQRIEYHLLFTGLK